MAASLTSRSSRRYLLQRAGADRRRAGGRLLARVVCSQLRIQREAVAAIEKAGGKVWYEWEWKDGKPSQEESLWVPAWLVDRAGVDYFGNVVAAEVYSPAADVTMFMLGVFTGWCT